MHQTKKLLYIYDSSKQTFNQLNQDHHLRIEYGVCSSPFGSCFIALMEQGICLLAFFTTEDEQKEIETYLFSEWKEAMFIQADAKIVDLGKHIFAPLKDKKIAYDLILKGTPFQIKVWQALLAIPKGHVVAYQDVAFAMQAPKAVRAVASAIAKNNIAYLIPCHRVIRQNADIGQYRWNKQRKQALITWEASSNENTQKMIQE